MDFASYLRYNMASLSNRWVIPFHEEMKHIESYLAIEKIRFEEKLQIHTDIQVEDFEVPALCVEPLVENAIKHGVRGRIAGGTVSIRTYRANGYNWIIVEDDGVGFDPEHISDKSIGIPNISKRLKMMEGVIFRIESQIGKGTRATIQLPLQMPAQQEVFHENIDRR
ncbi:MAG: histidine kinase, partial [Lachnospiraceae bacterium]|nr:histidine kinase [Lachnospiraceae bacterium]